MSDENEAEVKPNEEMLAMAEQLKEAQANNDSRKLKMDQLLSETKKAKDLQREAEVVATREAEEKAKKDGDFQQLHKSSEEARQALEERLTELMSANANEKRNTAAIKISSELADGYNAELLSGFVASRLKYTDDGLKVVDAAGNLTVSTVDDLKTEFQADARYAALLKGNQSSGGSANGSSANNGKAKVMTRADFDKQSPESRMKFMTSGGAIHD